MPAPTLVSFGSCESLLDGFRAAAAAHVGPYGFDGADQGVPTAATGRITPDVAAGSPNEAGAADQGMPRNPVPEYSATNTHEAGVDEPDLVKTDGRRVVSVVDGALRVLDVAGRRVTGTLPLTGGRAAQLLVSGDRALVVVSSSVKYPGPGPTRDQERPSTPQEVLAGSRLILVDLAGEPRVLSTLTVDGRYLDARQVGGVARVVVRSTPTLGFVYPDGVRTTDAALRENRGIVDRSTVEDWLPRFTLDTGSSRRSGSLVRCDQVRHAVSDSSSVSYSGTGLLTILTVDLARELGTGEPVSMTADGDTVYGTGQSLYIADDHRVYAMPRRPLSPAPPSWLDGRTDIHRFVLTGSQPPAYAGSAQVDGTLLNQYSLSEYAGHLRVATTIGVVGGVVVAGADSRSRVTVLAPKPGGSGMDGMVEVGRLDGLGKGERIYAVRFLGPVGYVVTFRRTDPLYTVDLSDPARPRLAGELKINGYSAYLHPAGDRALIGVGQDATEQGRTLGTQVSLFDVADPARPQRTAQFVLADGTSEVESDPHAFLYWPAKGLLVVPVTAGSRGTGEVGVPTSGALVLRVEPGRISEIGRVRHPAQERYGDVAVRRTLVIGNELWTFSAAGVLVSDLDHVTQLAWLPG